MAHVWTRIPLFDSVRYPSARSAARRSEAGLAYACRCGAFAVSGAKGIVETTPARPMRLAWQDGTCGAPPP